MKKFEYLVYEYTTGLSDMISEMDKAGKDGWEAIHIQHSSSGLLGTYTVFYKRELIE